MGTIDYKKLRVFVLGLIGVALILFLIGIADMPRTPYLGYRVSSTYAVVKVDAQSPAEQAGLKEGDQVMAIGNIPTEKLFQLSRQARPRIGEEQNLAIVRDLNWQEIEVKATSLPRKERMLAWSGNWLALVLLALGFTVFWRHPGKPTLLFFLSNFFLALAFMTPPYLESFVMRGIVVLNFLFFLTMGLAFFLHLSVVFPRTKPQVVETPVEILIYFPIPLMAFFFVSLRLFQPWADLRLNQFLYYAFALAVVYCLGLALAAITHSYWTSTAVRSRDLGWVLIASLIGVVPPALGVLFDSFFPMVRLPAREYYPLTVALVSVAFAMVLSRENPKAEPRAVRHVA
jgi:hypothetical protein